MPQDLLTNRTAQAVKDARLFVVDPVAAHMRPTRRMWAWAILKSARGQSLSQVNLRRMVDAQRATDVSAPLVQ